MGTNLQQTLRSLCFKTEWKYAVFWKLKLRARMLLTWEDAYYKNHEPLDHSENMSFNDTLENLHDGRYLQDPLGMAVAKMSYLVYSLGEGIIGQVAVTGKHQWIFADKAASCSWSSSEYCDGWQAQFLAGIRTIAVVSVVPYGVVQLGSLNTVIEDMKLVTHIKDAFHSLQNSSVEFLPSPVHYIVESNSCSRSDKAINNKKPDIQSHLSSSPGKCNELSQDVFPLPGPHKKNAVEVVCGHAGIESPTIRDNGSAELLQPKSGFFSLEHQNEVQMKVINNKRFGEKNSGWQDMLEGSKHNDAPTSCNLPAESANLNNFTLPVDKSGLDYPFLPLDLLDSAVWDRVVYLQNEEIHSPEPLETQLGKGLVQKPELWPKSSHPDTVNNSFMFSAGCELHEALGSAFKKEQDCCAWSESERTESGLLFEPPEGMISTWFSTECGSDLLEAVVANACPGSSNVKSESSLCNSEQSLLTTEKPPHKHGTGPAGGSVVKSSLLVEDDAHHHLNSIWESTGVGVVRSPKESSPKTLSTCSEQLEMRVEPARINRKRARPGESCRPRPRDRQLIQDRVKELRELVPNGSKCSIDALLEHTVKHMLFLQSVTKHADKLRKCGELKEMGLLGSCSREHGSSWALEVGSQTKVCPIIVENLNMNGQMLIKILCEGCNHFLEVAEAIRGLGLMILKGLMEARGEKSCACFVVEGQNNRGLRRMDILLSLMQLLQPKTTI